jgi:hypothetical protein
MGGGEINHFVEMQCLAHQELVTQKVHRGAMGFLCG